MEGQLSDPWVIGVVVVVTTISLLLIRHTLGTQLHLRIETIHE